MLDIPFTSSVTVKRAKKRRFFGKKKVNVDEIKETLIEKVNEETLSQECQNASEIQPETEMITEQNGPTILDGEVVLESPLQIETETSSISYKKPKKIRKSRVIGVQLAVIGMLVAGIFITNAVMPNSGINTFFSQVFGSGVSVSDSRNYTDFSPEIIPSSAGYVLHGGVINVNGKGSLYSPCNGWVEETMRGEDGKYTITIRHSDKFSTVISGLDYCYVEKDGKVLSKVPVGYTNQGAKMCFYSNDGAIIVNFTITDNTVVWAV
jgi:hypothetical protein